MHAFYAFLTIARRGNVPNDSASCQRLCCREFAGHWCVGVRPISAYGLQLRHTQKDAKNYYEEVEEFVDPASPTYIGCEYCKSGRAGSHLYLWDAQGLADHEASGGTKSNDKGLSSNACLLIEVRL